MLEPCVRGVLEKDENQGWHLFGNLTKKTLQWEPTSEKIKEFTFYNFERRAPILRIIHYC